MVPPPPHDKKEEDDSDDESSSREEDDNDARDVRRQEGLEDNNDGSSSSPPTMGMEGHGDAPSLPQDVEAALLPEEEPPGPPPPDTAATRIQGVFRRKKAREMAKQKAQHTFYQEYDKELHRYVFVNKKTGERRQVKPMFYREAAENPALHKVVTMLQAHIRRKLNKRVIMDKKKELFSKHYDPETSMTYYLDKRTGNTMWNKPYGMGRDDVDYTFEDALIHQKDDEIKKLKAQLDAKNKEVQQVLSRKAEEVEIMLRRQKIDQARIQGAEKRTPDMDLWTMEEVIAWLMEEGLGEYETQIVKNRVDGFVMVHLDSSDWDDMGIRKKIHQKRLDLLLEPFRARFKAKGHIGANTVGDDGSDSLSNTVSLSEIMARHENDVVTEEQTQHDQQGLPQTSTLTIMSPVVHEEFKDPRDLPPTEEQLEEKRKDRENILVEVIHEGSEAKPGVGDVVQVHYSTYLADTGKCIESSRNDRRRPFEFAIGLGQVIKAWDRALLDVGMGGRVKLQVTSDYAYGTQGLPPLIPPNADLIFDIEVLGFRNRPVWHKKYIQSPGLSETPYWIKPAESDNDYEKYVKGLKDIVKNLEKIKKGAQQEEQTELMEVAAPPEERSLVTKTTSSSFF